MQALMQAQAATAATNPPATAHSAARHAAQPLPGFGFPSPISTEMMSSIPTGTYSEPSRPPPPYNPTGFSDRGTYPVSAATTYHPTGSQYTSVHRAATAAQDVPSYSMPTPYREVMDVDREDLEGDHGRRYERLSDPQRDYYPVSDRERRERTRTPSEAGSGAEHSQPVSPYVVRPDEARDMEEEEDDEEVKSCKGDSRNGDA